jgi:hypothetical protein
MGYGCHIGRIGGLAVALGIGMALASSPLASAEPSDPGPAARSSTPDSATARTPQQTARRAAVATMTSRAQAPTLGTGGSNDHSQTPVAWAVLHVARRDTRRSVPRNAAASTVTSQGPAISPNLLANPGAEVGDPSLSGNSSVSIPGWTVTGTPTVIQYGTPRNMWPVGLPFATPDLPPCMGFPTTSSGAGDTQFFGGGNVATSTLTQTVTFTAASAAGVTYDLGAQLGGWLINPGAASVEVDFLDANKLYLGTASLGPVTMFERFFQTVLKDRSTTGTLPTGTQFAQVTVNLHAWNPIFPGLNADYNSAFADNISFTVSAPGLAPAPVPPEPPVSKVGALDHVFMVYMENKGYDDIVGSPNAPFLNSLINAYGFADNYYALTHGSSPNYYPIVGGTDFGLTYNCASPCIDASTTLVSNIDDAGKTWRSYAQGLIPGASPLVSTDSYQSGETVFPAFTSIANDPAYAAAHIRPLEEMAVDLRSAATAPNYAWFAANEDFAGEGPVNTLEGFLKFALTQIGPKHQYNVPALDQFLSETVPTIMNSAVWNDPNEASVIVVTFDEDNNNLSLGFGNEGNHIVTVVIPNQAAIDAGMRSGPFIASSHLDHYSLLRMIEDSLGLPTLTNNDKYAAPMNEFWTDGVVGNSGNIAV